MFRTYSRVNAEKRGAFAVSSFQFYFKAVVFYIFMVTMDQITVYVKGVACSDKKYWT